MKRVLSIDSSCYAIDQVNDSARIQIIQEDDLHRSSKINEIINFINTEVNELIKNYTPYDQEEIDDKLRHDWFLCLFIFFNVNI